jgi:tetratricopeptide (TPR) repeat protein
MPNQRRAMVWFLSLLLLIPGLAFAQKEYGTLVGKVVDAKGDPLAGVTVTITSPDVPDFKEVRTTDEKGDFSVDYKDIGVTYHYKFVKSGYQTTEANQHWDLQGTQFFQWTMPAAGAPVTGPHAPENAPLAAVGAYNGGVKAFNAQDYAKAAEAFKKAVDEDPAFLKALEGLATAEEHLGHDQEAADTADKAVALGSTDSATLMARWQAYRHLGDEAKAAQALKDLQKSGVNSEEAKKVHNEGVALLKKKDYAGAFEKFQAALHLDPTLQPSLVGLAEAGIELGHYQEAADAAETILAVDPHNEQAIRLQYNACLGLGNKERLGEALVALAPYEPKIARDGLLQLAFDAYDKRDMAKSVERFKEALAIDPNYALAHYYLGVVDIGQGAYAEAKTHLERFLQLAPDNKEADSARDMLEYLSKQK